METNRVDLDPDVKDAWGLPAMRITSTSHDNDFKAMQFFIDKSVEILKAAGATEVWADQVSAIPRRRAFPRHLPHGQRSQVERGEQVSPRP